MDGGTPKKYSARQFIFNIRFLLIVAAVVIAIIITIGVGVGVPDRCLGKFPCPSSYKCIRTSARCDGVVDCVGGEDEYNCVRLSGKNSVLQVFSSGSWRTVCYEDWSETSGRAACKQLGYSRYINSSFLPVSEVEDQFQKEFASINLNHTKGTNNPKLHDGTLLRDHCNRGFVTTLKCIECGSRPVYTPRIVGGNDSRIGQWPWQVSLHFKGQHLCGGAIITSQWIATAAHCVVDFDDVTSWAVLLGIVNQPVTQVLAHSVEKIIYNPRYKSQSNGYDIALMKLKKLLTFNGYIEPICLPNYGEDYPEGELCWISGWGATVEGGDSPIQMKYAAVPLISSKVCNQPTVYWGAITPTMICAGYLQGGIDSCQGDSGGPLACEDNNAWKLVGITSWGMGCAEVNKPGVYSRISSLLDWIYQQMENEASNP
ncbi:transmembrane protease serine 3-like [Protopterus annectens]|uniref:transmembrane protease serine 3-like n=1 Tax=Protopterus annectens TaxID=7888 RepID=UPI001CFA1630|nr:transmembrane protease serine 3-like [Protopterus annectens]